MTTAEDSKLVVAAIIDFTKNYIKDEKREIDFKKIDELYAFTRFVATGETDKILRQKFVEVSDNLRIPGAPTGKLFTAPQFSGVIIGPVYRNKVKGGDIDVLLLSKAVAPGGVELKPLENT